MQCGAAPEEGSRMAEELTVNLRNANGDATAWAERVVDEIIDSWRHEEPCAEQAFARYPALANHPEAAVRLVHEEFCHRRAAGKLVSSEEMYQRFPQWRAPLEVLLRRHAILDLQPAPPDWPASGEDFGEFRLVAEIGRGAQGRVFLATQIGLANRPVVLKVTARTGQEHLTLARLQHTHIVPLYTAHDDSARNLRVLCMPYFGGLTLHELLQILRATPPAERSGQQILATLDLGDARWLPNQPSSSGATRQLLGRLSYTQAICWIGACLADALHYAHERGLIHLDVKPSNVLLAADGQPMLLDFHIAQEPVRPNGPRPEHLGGTPLYAAPEQRAALEAVEQGSPIRVLVDGRADVYSLGMLLREALEGDLTTECLAQPLRRLPSHIPWGLADILNKCLAARPEERYANAGALAEDLRRHLSDLPLRGVPNRSLRERWLKWRRRRPAALRLTIMATAVLAAAVAVGMVTFGQVRQRSNEAEAALKEGRRQLRARAYAEAVGQFSHGLAVARSLPRGGELIRELRHELRHARRAWAAQQLHGLVDRLRFLHGGAGAPDADLRSLRPVWQAVWAKRSLLLDCQAAELPPQAEERLRADLLDLGVIWADLSVHLAEASERKACAMKALEILNETEKLLGPGRLLARQRQVCAAAAGLPPTIEQLPADLQPPSPWELYALGRLHLQTGELERAAEALGRAVEMQPKAFWPNFHRGVCAHKRALKLQEAAARKALPLWPIVRTEAMTHKLLQEAIRAFEVCVALAPDKAECYYNRGLVHAALAEYEPALRDYATALRLNPRMGAAALNRGLLHYARKQYAEAEADLQQALACRTNPATVYYTLALICRARGERLATISKLGLALRANPEHAGARRLLHQLEMSAPAGKPLPGQKQRSGQQASPQK